MGLKAGSTANKGGGSFESPAAGGYVAKLVMYAHVGIQIKQSKFGEKRGAALVLMYGLDSADSKGNPFTHFEVLTDSLYMSSTLKKRLVVLLGRDIGDDDEPDLNEAIGKCGMLYLKESDRGNTYTESFDKLQTPGTIPQDPTLEGAKRFVAKMRSKSEGGIVDVVVALKDGVLVDGTYDEVLGNVAEDKKETTDSNTDKEPTNGKSPF